MKIKKYITDYYCRSVFGDVNGNRALGIIVLDNPPIFYCPYIPKYIGVFGVDIIPVDTNNNTQDENKEYETV